ncbi:uncharacterized protein LOC115986525 [Quercus lobata]|nr:uncharacterized protein LOC115986525 [Quercus lobata]
MALGVIRYSSEGPLKWAIWKITSAKIAWDTLAAICTLPKSSFIVPEEYDYVAWSVRMKAYLKACDLWDIVEAATQSPKPEDDEIAFNAWSKKDAIALYLIRESSSAFYSSLFPAGTAQNAWDILAKFYNSEGRENSELRKYVLFKQYLRDGNWAAANQFITSNPGAESAIISNTRSTALHIAIIAGHLHIVKELVNMLPTDKLRMTDKDGNTVLGCCALVGNTEMAKCIVEKCPMLLSIANANKFDKLIPVVMALTCNSNSIATARYLYSVTPPGSLSPGKGSVNGATFVTRCIYSKNFDMALDVLEKFPTLVTALDIEKESPVLALASMSFPYTSENQLISWKRWIYNCIRIPGVDDINQIPVSIQKPEKGKSTQVRNIGLGIRQTYDYEPKHQYKKLLLRMCQEFQCSSDKQLEKGLVYEAIFKATKKGMVEFVTAIWSACPELVSAEEEFTWRNPFMCAVLYRQYEIFRLLCCFSLKDSILAATDDEGNNILHMAAMTEPSARRNTIPGAAFHMQRDLQWFKEVKSIVSPSLIEAENDDGFTPQDLFVENHKGLVDQAKNWIKETTSSCTVPAILIVIIMFAAAITVRGGDNQNTSLPVYLKDKVFMLFMLSNALFLVSATTSLLVFHTITSRNLEEDFLISLPHKMIIGLSSLIFSIAPMMVNFCTSLSIILDGNLWVVIPIICLVAGPVILFAWKQVHLLLAMVASTYRPRIFDRNVKPWM